VKTAVVVDPTNEDGLHPTGDFLQGEIITMMQLPPTHDFAHRLACFVAHRWGETDEQLSSTAHRLSGSKREAQKIESLLRISVASVRILAVDNLRLLRMQF
jgi:hypothetical protein